MLADLQHISTLMPADHGSWSYWTVIMKSPARFKPGPGEEYAQWESDGSAWLTADELLALPLHPGFAQSFPSIRQAVTSSVIEAMADD